VFYAINHLRTMFHIKKKKYIVPTECFAPKTK